VHEKNGPFHPIQSYYAGRIGERVSDPKEADHRFLWLPAEDVRGRFYPEMQNWALEMYLNEKEQRGSCSE
jgi:8-oxo-dGTP diphosphatase